MKQSMHDEVTLSMKLKLLFCIILNEANTQSVPALVYGVLYACTKQALLKNK